MATPKIYAGLGEIEKAVGTTLGVSGWHRITQDQIDHFARPTGDDQWIHLDPERGAQGPYGANLAHGSFVLSLVPMLFQEAVRFEGLQGAMSYSDKVRFPAPTLVDSQVRGRVLLAAFQPTDLGARTVQHVTVECKDGEKPVCVAEVVSVLIR
jgi:acyl dehydratase